MANWISDPQFDPQGRPYVTALADGPGMKKGDVRYISPAEVSPTNAYGADPRLASWAKGSGQPGQTLLKQRGQWNAQTGKWDTPANWSNLMTMGVGAEIAAPFIVGALTGPTVGPGTSALATNTPSLAVPTATQTALNTSPYVLGGIGPEVGSGLTAAQMAAITGAGAMPTVASLMGQGGDVANPANNRPPETQANGNAANPSANPPSSTNTGTNGFQLPYGIKANDLAGYGLGFFNNWMNRNAANDQSEARAAADKAALDFAIRAYDEQKALEQARWDANETRRVPYRRASLDTLAEFRKLLGLGD